MNEFKKKTDHIWKSLSRGRLPYLETETCWWILVSGLDFAMTFLLLGYHQVPFVESNPIANRFYENWGPKGLLGFKIFMALFVAVLCQIIATQKLETARRVLQFGTLVVAAVVVYSVCLHVKGAPVF